MGFSVELRPNIERLAQPLPPQIAIERVVIQPTNELYRPVSSQLDALIIKAVYRVDKALEKLADNCDNRNLVSRAICSDSSGREFLAYALETQRVQNTILSSIERSLVSDSRIRAIGLMQGAVPGIVSLWNLHEEQAYRARIEPVRMSGYIGELAVEAEVSDVLSGENSDARLIIVVDDVWDSGHEIAGLLQALERMRCIDSEQDKIHSLSYRLKIIRNTPFEKHIDLYDEVIARCHAAGVVIAPLFYKNKPFRDRLESYIRLLPSHDVWSALQEELLGPSLIFSQHAWIKGDGLDTDVDGYNLLVDVFKRLRDPIAYDPTVQQLWSHLRHAKIRIGSFVDGIIQMNRTNKHDLREFAADHIAPAIIDWVRVGYKWQDMPAYADMTQ